MRSVSIKFGGIKRDFRIEIGDAPKFESATGLGAFELYRQLHNKSATTTTLVETLRVALAGNGASYTTDEIFKMIRIGGLIEAYAVAEALVMQLFLLPEETKAGAEKKSKPAGGRQTVSH